MVQIQHAKEDAQPWTNEVDKPPTINRFYVLKGRDEQEKSTDVDNGNLLVFSFTFYALLYQGSTFYMVNP